MICRSVSQFESILGTKTRTVLMRQAGEPGSRLAAIMYPTLPREVLTTAFARSGMADRSTLRTCSVK
jgi:hypothetical protein